MRSFCRIALMALTVFMLGACGDNEPEQRVEFKRFLQSRIIDKPGLEIPTISVQQHEDFGLYARHYAIIWNFHQTVDKGMKRLSKTLQKSALHSYDQVLTRRSDLDSCMQEVVKMRLALDEALRSADLSKAQVIQPVDLVPVFDKAYEKTVRVPARSLAEVLSVIDAAWGDFIAFSDFLRKHGDQIVVQDSVFWAKTPALERQLDAFIDRLDERGQEVLDAQEQLHDLLSNN